MHISLNNNGMDVLQLSVILRSKEGLYLAASFHYSHSVRQVFRDPKLFQNSVGQGSTCGSMTDRLPARSVL